MDVLNGRRCRWKPDDAPGRRGRLHGRLLQALGGVSAIATVVALWQFGVFGADPDGDPVNAIDGLETVWLPGGEDAPSATDSTDAASATVESPSESTATEASVSPSSEGSSPLPPSSATPAEETGADVTAGCSASLVLTRAWDDSIEASVKVINTGPEAIKSWEIVLALDGAEIYHVWNMRKLDGDRYGSEDWNSQLDPDENAMLGFLANVEHDFELPGSAPCTVQT